jgi:hypothetical protein
MGITVKKVDVGGGGGGGGGGAPPPPPPPPPPHLTPTTANPKEPYFQDLYIIGLMIKLRFFLFVCMTVFYNYA